MCSSCFRILLLSGIAFAMNITTAQHYRGLCALNDSTVWLSGSKGFVVRTNNGGKSWDTLNPNGYEKKDFRDIHAWNNKEAVIISAGDSAVMLRTSNGGATWKVIISDNSEGVFWDAMDVLGKRIILVGDGHGKQGGSDMRLGSLSGKFRSVQSSKLPNASSFYAASGTNVQWLGKDLFAAIPVNKGISYFQSVRVVSGNKRNVASKYPFVRTTAMPFKNQQAGGAYSFCMRNAANGAAVGGSYLLPDNHDSVACYTSDSGKTWLPASSAPNGYRSCVAFRGTSPMGICTGTNGTDITRDGGISWSPASNKGYNVCAFTANYVWLAGNKGSWEKTAVSALFPK